MIELRFRAETTQELDAQVRGYLEATGGLRHAVATDLDVDRPASPESSALTNEHYRRAIKAIPPGRVAAYSVVSEVVRGNKAGSQKVAGIAANDASLGTAYRVVKKDGAIAAGFRWTDGRMGGADEGRSTLEEEGVRFDIHGRVQPDCMLSVDQLRALYEAGH